MNVLLDTHTFLWWESEPEKIPPEVLFHIENGANQVILSVVSVWELQIKKQLGKLSLRCSLREMIARQQKENGLTVLPVILSHILVLDELPLLHKDPFDRLLIAQAKAEGLAIASRDKSFMAYDVTVIW